MKKLKDGQIVRIHFLDHVEGDDEPCEFEVFGRVIKHDAESTAVVSWAYAGERNRADDSNVTSFCIVNKAIKQIDILK